MNIRKTTLIALLGTLGLAAAPALADDDRHESGSRHYGPKPRHSEPDHCYSQGHWRGREPDREDRFSVGIRLGSPGYRSGRWETREQRVCVREGYWTERYVPAVVKVVHPPCGKPYKVLVRPARCERVWVEPAYETRCVRVWVPCDTPPHHDRLAWSVNFRWSD